MYQLGEAATVRTVVTLYELQITAQLALPNLSCREVTSDPKMISITKLVESERSAIQSDQNWD